MIDRASDWFGEITGLYKGGAATNSASKLTLRRRDDTVPLTKAEQDSMYDESGNFITDPTKWKVIPDTIAGVEIDQKFQDEIKKQEEEEKKLVADQEQIRNNNRNTWSEAPGYVRPVSFGWPTTTKGYNQVMQELSDRNDIHVKFLKALAKIESTTKIKNDGTLDVGEYLGDLGMGIAGARGLFHVRKGNPESPAGVDAYNEKHKNDKGFTPVTWQDISTDTLLAAHIGAEHFAHLYKLFEDPKTVPKGSSREAEAYAAYNAGWGWRTRTKPDGTPRYGTATQARIIARGRKFAGWIAESKNYSNKSAILEGIALAA